MENQKEQGTRRCVEEIWEVRMDMITMYCLCIKEKKKPPRTEILLLTDASLQASDYSKRVIHPSQGNSLLSTPMCFESHRAYNRIVRQYLSEVPKATGGKAFTPQTRVRYTNQAFFLMRERLRSNLFIQCTGYSLPTS